MQAIRLKYFLTIGEVIYDHIELKNKRLSTVELQKNAFI